MATMAMPATVAEGRRAAKAFRPKRRSEAAVSHICSGGFSNQSAPVPVGDEPGVEGMPGQHLAGDLGVDAFVPVGEGAMTEERKEDQGGEKGGEKSGSPEDCGGMRGALVHGLHTN